MTSICHTRDVSALQDAQAATPSPRLAVDRASPVPLYFQVAQQLEALIGSGHLAAGSRLENEVALAEQLGVSRPTMRAAIQYLVDRGLVARRRGIGTEVMRPLVRRPAELTSLFDDLQKSGQRPRTTVISLTEEPAPDAIAEALELPAGSVVQGMVRLRYAADEPLALMRNYLPAGLADLTVEALSERGLYAVLRSAGVAPKVAAETIGAKAATAAEARSLGEARGAALLTMTRVARDWEGRPIEYGSHLYRSSRHTFEITLTAG